MPVSQTSASGARVPPPRNNHESICPVSICTALKQIRLYVKSLGPPPTDFDKWGGDTERRRLLGLYRRVTVTPQTCRVAKRRTAQAAEWLGGTMMAGNYPMITRLQVPHYFPPHPFLGNGHRPVPTQGACVPRSAEGIE